MCLYLRESELKVLVIILLNVKLTGTVLWDEIQCSPDGDQSVPEGRVPDIWRFPWLGLVQHSFEIGGQMKYAVTPAVLIHPAFATASAADMSKIPPEQMSNNTVLIFWKSPEEKYAIEIIDYILHPEFQSGVTMASIALLQLVSYNDMGITVVGAPVLPVCMPIKGSIATDQLYAVKMTDERGEIEKNLHKMTFVDDKDCEEFYYRAELTFEKLSPKSAICAAMEAGDEPCVWDAGTALVTRQNWGYWTLVSDQTIFYRNKLGFGVRGPGCGAPAKFLVFHDYLPWINQVIDNLPFEDDNDLYKLALRHKSPVEIIMYKASVKIPIDQGQCDRKIRGSVVYKENHELLLNKNFAQGFFFVGSVPVINHSAVPVAEGHKIPEKVCLRQDIKLPSFIFSTIEDLASFSCALIRLEVASRTNAAIWLEHNCHRDMTGKHSYTKRHDVRMQECFLYFKTAAFLEFRFYFSFKAAIDVTIYGERRSDQFVPDPNPISESTYAWWPTETIIDWDFFFPYGRPAWNL